MLCSKIVSETILSGRPVSRKDPGRSFPHLRSRSSLSPVTRQAVHIKTVKIREDHESDVARIITEATVR